MLNPNKIEQIFNHYGADHQIDKACEELQELIDALRNPNATADNVCEEIADVMVMLEQLKYGFDCKQRADEIAKHKVDRTIKIMQGKCAVAKQDRPSYCGKYGWACKVCEGVNDIRRDADDCEGAESDILHKQGNSDVGTKTV